eukprot:3237875-Prymnesium_polylepis.1
MRLTPYGLPRAPLATAQARLSRPDELRAHSFFADTRWGALYAKQLTSPLLPSARGAPSSAHTASPAVLDVFDYPSVLPTPPQQ